MSEKQGNTSPKRLNRKWGMVALMCGLPFFFFFCICGEQSGQGKSRSTLCCALSSLCQSTLGFKEPRLVLGDANTHANS